MARTLYAESSVRRRSCDQAARARSAAIRASIQVRSRCSTGMEDGLETVDAHGPQCEARVLDDLGLERAEPEPVATLEMGEQRISCGPCRDWLRGERRR